MTDFKIFDVITLLEGRDMIRAHLTAAGREDLAQRVVVWTENRGTSFKPGRRLLKVIGPPLEGADKAAMEEAQEFMLNTARRREAGL